jgi:hypothetical protein
VVGNMVIGFVYAYRVLILTKLESFDDWIVIEAVLFDYC